MSDRWRKPAVILQAKDSHDTVIVEKNGRVSRGIDLTVHPDDIARMRAGYLCQWCLEPFETADPDPCPLCQWPLDRRKRYFDAQFDPKPVRVGPSFDINDEIARLDHELAEDNWVEAGSTKGILVPRRLGG